MTVKTVSSAVAFSDANTPPASISAAGTVFKSFILLRSPYNIKRDHTVSETFLRINDKATIER